MVRMAWALISLTSTFGERVYESRVQFRPSIGFPKSVQGIQTPHFIPADAIPKASAGILSEPEPLEQALQSPEQIKANISYLYVTTGSLDPITGPATKAFVERLNKLNIPYTYEEYADEVHSMNVWRPSVNNFVAKLFQLKS